MDYKVGDPVLLVGGDGPPVFAVVVEEAAAGAERVTVETAGPDYQTPGERLSVEAERLRPCEADEVEDVLRRLERAGVLRRGPRRGRGSRS